MTQPLIGLIGGIWVGAAVLALGLVLRLPVGRRLIVGVDWTRVSDPNGLAHCLSLLTTTLAALILLSTLLLYAWHDAQWLRNGGHEVLSVVMGANVIAMFFVKRRFQDRPTRDGER